MSEDLARTDAAMAMERAESNGSKGRADSRRGERAFDPSKYLRKLAGKDYLEVKWRLLWLRTEHPDAVMHTEMVRLEDSFALFKAHVALPGGGESTGWGSETRQDFFDFIEKAETKAIGRALAALGFGTQFCEDFDFAAGSAGNAHVVDSPVSSSSAGESGGQPTRPAPVAQPSSSLATPAQLKLIYLTATRDLRITEEELEARCQERYGRLPLHLTKREASELIDSMRSSQASRAN